MRRSNRSIEVFDISLMAVVTKAMGAFLVLMLLLMPYYSSGPIGEQNVIDLTRALKEAEARLKMLEERLGQTPQDPEELRRLLEDARHQLEDAQRIIALLKRDNDALNSQVQRLDEENKGLRNLVAKLNSENEDLHKRLGEQDLVSFAGQMLNWDCNDVVLTLLLSAKDAYVATKDQGHLTNILNYNSVGKYDTATDSEILVKFPEQAINTPGRGRRFNQSTVFHRFAPGQYFVLLTARSKSETPIRGIAGRLLKAPAENCSVLWSWEYFIPRNESYNSSYTTELTFPKGQYAVVLHEFTVKPDGIQFSGGLLNPSEDAKAWLRDQIAQAAKEPLNTTRKPQQQFPFDDPRQRTNPPSPDKP